MHGRVIIAAIASTGEDAGDHLSDIACVETIDGKLTGRLFQAFLNPDAGPAEEAPEIPWEERCISENWRELFPTFDEEADKLLSFIGDAAIGVCDADREQQIINSELLRIGRPPIDRARFFSIPGAQTRSPREALYALFDMEPPSTCIQERAEAQAALYIANPSGAH